MENGGGGGAVDPKISAEDVISKLKNDGDFDRLRLKIIRKLKENEELRNGIISMVKQSEALNRPGAEKMKPRQLSDTIHQEIGAKITSQVSDGVWELIRSGNGMKSEIADTVHSVYNRLLNPKGNENGESSSHNDLMPDRKRLKNNGSITATTGEIDDTLSDSEPNEPPGFSMFGLHQNSNTGEKSKEQLLLPMPHGEVPTVEEEKESYRSQDALEPNAIEDASAPPGFSTVMGQKQPCDYSDEDPDLPPGFG